jgi:hypothetical protein
MTNEQAIQALQGLIDALKVPGSHLEIDWFSHRIDVLGAPETHPTKKLSGGRPLISWPILARFE